MTVKKQIFILTDKEKEEILSLVKYARENASISSSAVHRLIDAVEKLVKAL